MKCLLLFISMMILTSQPRVLAQEDIIPIAVDVPIAPTPVKADGQVQLVYELHITNFAPVSLELTKVEVLGDDTNAAPLASYEGAELADRLARYGVSAELPNKRVIGGGLRAIMLFHLSLASEADVPKTLHHRLFLKNEGGEEAVVEGVPVLVQKRAPLVISSPLRGEGWLVADDGIADTSDHRLTLMMVDGKASIAQRFAEDWILVGTDGQVFHDDPAANANWYGYGAEVLAVADAVVVAVKDGISENIPLTNEFAVPILLDTIGGNYVFLELGDGYFAWYGHLQPNSIRVKVGDKVQRGEVLGLLGNSGNSDAPHLHFHMTNANSPLGAEGVPYIFETFDVQGKVESLDVFENGEGWKQPQTLRADKRELELPVEYSVIRFP